MKNKLKNKFLFLLVILSLLITTILSSTVFASTNVLEIEDSALEIEMSTEHLQAIEKGEVVFIGETSAPIGNSRTKAYDVCTLELYVGRDAVYGNVYELTYRVHTTGIEKFNGIVADPVTVKNTSVLFPSTYLTTKLNDGFNATTSFYGDIGVFVVDDSDVSKVSVKASGVKVYSMSAAAWQSLISFNQTITLP